MEVGRHQRQGPHGGKQVVRHSPRDAKAIGGALQSGKGKPRKLLMVARNQGKRSYRKDITVTYSQGEGSYPKETLIRGSHPTVHVLQ